MKTPQKYSVVVRANDQLLFSAYSSDTMSVSHFKIGDKTPGFTDFCYFRYSLFDGKDSDFVGERMLQVENGKDVKFAARLILDAITSLENEGCDEHKIYSPTHLNDVQCLDTARKTLLIVYEYLKGSVTFDQAIKAIEDYKDAILVLGAKVLTYAANYQIWKILNEFGKETLEKRALLDAAEQFILCVLNDMEYEVWK